MGQKNSQSSHVKMPLVGIIMGSQSDLEFMSAAADILESFSIVYELTVVSAHRTPKRMFEYAQSARARGLKVIIAAAGGAAHLPGMIASLTPLPVIGVPIRAKESLQGLDSLLSIVQMPTGIPVATVAINASANAGILAAQIIGTSDEKVLKKVEEYKISLKDKVEKSVQEIETKGFRALLKKVL